MLVDDDVGIGIDKVYFETTSLRLVTSLSLGRAIAEWRFSRVSDSARKLPLGCVLRKIREKCGRIEIIPAGK